MKGVTKSSIGKALYQSLALACVMFSGYVGPASQLVRRQCSIT